MRCVHHETDYPGPILLWPDYSQSRQFGHSIQRIDRKIDIVLKNFGASDSFEIIDCRAQSNCAGDIRSSSFETLRRFLIGNFFKRKPEDNLPTALPCRS